MLPIILRGIEPRFKFGQLMLTAGVNNEIATNAAFSKFVITSIRRHAVCDWGELEADDKKANDRAFGGMERLFSAYEKQGLPKIWIITECDRSYTTVLFPDEY